MHNPKEKPSASFIRYSDLFKDVYDRAIANKLNKSLEVSNKTLIPAPKP